MPYLNDIFRLIEINANGGYVRVLKNDNNSYFTLLHMNQKEHETFSLDYINLTQL